jgi:metal-responsive CopG/Arc/MetJ family transcriptional regulator
MSYHKGKYWKVDETRPVTKVTLMLPTNLVQELDDLLIDLAVSTKKKRYWSRSRLIESLIRLGLDERVKKKDKYVFDEIEDVDFEK